MKNSFVIDLYLKKSVPASNKLDAGTLFLF